ncbi:OsmC family protein [Micromonospora soli]|uniref:OsmC family protein n=1 Tax=Micromonospora sp. NBRC 110009 TaxID=3061627 RepID=UPI0026731B9A|nr:OsmC family protein [Micromonospora sp. NBRC 110009]WKT98513.1 OsmC family protein [Micromonospora sp. NBRC 110009]
MKTDQDRVVASARAVLPATERRRTDMSTRGFTFVADEPHNGALGEGPTPTEYLLMALASCTAQTLRQYVDYKYDTAGDITVEIDYHEPEQEGAERYLQRTITLSEEPDPDDLKVMHDIAEKSPVTLLIQFAWSVRTEFVGPR